MPPGHAMTSPRIIAGKENRLDGCRSNLNNDATSTPIGSQSDNISVRLIVGELTTIGGRATLIQVLSGSRIESPRIYMKRHWGHQQTAGVTAWAVLAALTLAPSVASAQDGAIAGTVTDTTSLVLPGVTVEVRSTVAGWPRPSLPMAPARSPSLRCRPARTT